MDYGTLYKGCLRIFQPEHKDGSTLPNEVEEYVCGYLERNSVLIEVLAIK